MSKRVLVSEERKYRLKENEMRKVVLIAAIAGMAMSASASLNWSSGGYMRNHNDFRLQKALPIGRLAALLN